MGEPTQLPTTDVASPEVTPAVPSYGAKEKHSRAFSFVSVLFLLMILIAGIMTYLWYNQQQIANGYQADITALQSEKGQLQASIDKLKKQNANLGNAVVDQVANNSAEKSDKELLVASVKAYVHAQAASANSTVEVDTINYKTGATIVLVPYTAKNPTGGQGGCIVKKSDAAWVVIACGQGLPDQATLTLFGIPSSFRTSL